MTVAHDPIAPDTGSDCAAQARDTGGRGKWRTIYAAVGLTVGSGTCLTGPSLRGLTLGTHTRALAPQPEWASSAALSAVAALPAAAVAIDEIRTCLTLSMSEIAKATGRSRQAVYKWVSGDSRPEPPAAKVLTQLAAVARRLQAAQVRHPGAALKMGLFSGQSLLDLIAGGDFEEADVATVIRESLAGQRAYDRSGASRSATPPSAVWAIESVPTSSNG